MDGFDSAVNSGASRGSGSLMLTVRSHRAFWQRSRISLANGSSSPHNQASGSPISFPTWANGTCGDVGYEIIRRVRGGVPVIAPARAFRTSRVAGVPGGSTLRLDRTPFPAVPRLHPLEGNHPRNWPDHRVKREQAGFPGPAHRHRRQWAHLHRVQAARPARRPEGSGGAEGCRRPAESLHPHPRRSGQREAENRPRRRHGRQSLASSSG